MEEKTLVEIFVESRYKVNRKRIKAKVLSVLGKEEVAGPVELSVAIVGDRKMRELSKKYKNEDKTRNILSFSMLEGQSSRPSSDRLILGDIVISYPQVIKEAARDEVLVDDKIDQLTEHGLMHLLGLHHDE